MAVCRFCGREMTDKVSCTLASVTFSGGEAEPSVPFTPLPRLTPGEWMEGWRRSRDELRRLRPDLPDDTEEKARARCAEYQRTWDLCHDCGCPAGGFHHPGCDAEVCPRCGGQLISCGCLAAGEGDENEEDR